jgi:hypothetical protein
MVRFPTIPRDVSLLRSVSALFILSSLLFESDVESLQPEQSEQDVEQKTQVYLQQ